MLIEFSSSLVLTLNIVSDPKMTRTAQEGGKKKASRNAKIAAKKLDQKKVKQILSYVKSLTIYCLCRTNCFLFLLNLESKTVLWNLDTR